MTLPAGPDPTRIEDPSGPVASTGRRLALPEDPNRRALALGGVALGVLLLLFIASRLLLGGGAGEPDDTTTPPPPSPETTTTTISELVAPPAESFEVFSTKNPFTPLISPIGGGGARSGGSGGSSPGGGTGGGSPSGGSTQTTIGGGATGGGSTQTTIGGGASGGGSTQTTRGGGDSGGRANEPRRSQRIALLDVMRRAGRLVVQVRVNDTVYTAGEGETFADNYRVLSIDESGECARFVYGDEQFRLCRGEETLK